MFGFNLSERYFVVINFLLVGVIVYFLANSVVDILNLRLASNVVPATSEAAMPARRARVAGGLSRVSYEPIIQRDVFDLAPAPETAPVETEEDLPVKLLGTSHLTSSKPYIIVEDATGTQSLYRLGDNIPSVGRLMEVGEDRAVVLHNGHRVALTFPRDDEQQQVNPAARPDRRRPPFVHNPILRRGRLGLRRPLAPGAGVRRVSPNRYVLDRSTVDGNLQNMPKLFTEIRAVPNLQNGTSNGFRLSEIESGSIFQQLGLQDGDILTSVSGQPMTDPARALALLSSLRNSSSITLGVMRNGSPMQLFYTIH